MLRCYLTVLALFAASLLHAAPAFEVVAEFARPGLNPASRLLAHTDGYYYGTTPVGGTYNLGTVYRMSPAGVITTLVSFSGSSGPAKGGNPGSGLTAGVDGFLYGTTFNGGAGDFGTIYKVSTAGVFSTVAEFTGDSGAFAGAVPNDLVLHPDGSFYGTTQAGGTNSLGTVFKLSSTGTLTTLAHFSGTAGVYRGMSPSGRLVFSGSTLYGTTQWGGASDCGTVFKIDTSGGSWNVILDFTGTEGSRPGCNPTGLAIASSLLFGATEMGGADDVGVVFRIGLSGGNHSVLRHFSGADGAYPAGQIIATPDGSLFGTTSVGGTYDAGTVFKFGSGATPSMSTLASFGGSEGTSPGSGPRAALTVGLNGELFGTTEAGGISETGTVFQITTAGVLSSLANFTTTHGWKPIGAPRAISGAVLFPLKYGGQWGSGTIVRVPQTGIAALESAFPEWVGPPNGSLLPVNGAMFGVSDNRVYFAVPQDQPPTLVSVLGASLGEDAEELSDGGDGFFYGASNGGGAAGKGAIFRVSEFGSPQLVATFSGANGAAPAGPLARGVDGLMYGVTTGGGVASAGTVFKVSGSGTLGTLFSFSATGPRKPEGGLVAGIDGNFYGTTMEGGAAGKGTVFRITPGGAFTVFAEFTGSGGAAPGAKPSRLLVALDGTLYGTTGSGGWSDCGTVFRIAQGSALQTLFHFSGFTGNARGRDAEGKLGFGPGGVLYGITPDGGSGGGGTAFRIPGAGPHAGNGAAPVVSGASLLLNGVVQAGGEAGSAWFEFGPTASLGQNTQATAFVPGSEPTLPFTASILQPAAGLTVYFRARASTASGSSAGPISSYTAPTASEQWKQTMLGDPAAPDLGDPDGDGMATILEYALLQHPAVSGNPPPPGIGAFPEGRRMTMTLQRDPSRNDISIEVLAAPGAAGPWTVVASSVNGAPFSGLGYVSGETAGTAVRTVIIKDSAADPADSRRFMRIRVVH
ncbi:MAG: hypothetical protein RL088_3477 [Verrucomicrobiota bacterium]|jgi:uncharacterized repeat protein (TIGR03803 family)